jgi:hypothetical protein
MIPAIMPMLFLADSSGCARRKEVRKIPHAWLLHQANAPSKLPELGGPQGVITCPLNFLGEKFPG